MADLFEKLKTLGEKPSASIFDEFGFVDQPEQDISAIFAQPVADAPPDTLAEALDWDPVATEYAAEAAPAPIVIPDTVFEQCGVCGKGIRPGAEISYAGSKVHEKCLQSARELMTTRAAVTPASQQLIEQPKQVTLEELIAQVQSIATHPRFVEFKAKISSDASACFERLKVLKVEDKASLADLVAILDLLKGQKKSVEEFFALPKKVADALHSTICKMEKELKEAVDKAKARGDRMFVEYDDRVKAEAARLAAELERDRQAQADALRKQAEESGDPEEAEAALEMLEALSSTTVVAPESNADVASGIHLKKTYFVEKVELESLILAVADTIRRKGLRAAERKGVAQAEKYLKQIDADLRTGPDVPTQALEAAESFIKKQANDLDGDLHYPGVTLGFKKAPVNRRRQ